MSGRVTVEGGPEMAAALRNLGDDLVDEIPPSDIAAAILPPLQAVTPRDTGRLVSSLQAVVTADHVTVTANTPYAKYVKAWPIEDALDTARAEVLNNYAAAVAAAVNKIG